MARLYVSLRLSDNTPVIQYGCSENKVCEKHYYNLQRILGDQKTPCFWNKLEEYDGAIIKYCNRRTKEVRKACIFILENGKLNCYNFDKNEKIPLKGTSKALEYYFYKHVLKY